MFRTIARRACARFGNDVRCTSSFFRASKNDLAIGLLQQNPVRPSEALIPND